MYTCKYGQFVELPFYEDMQTLWTDEQKIHFIRTYRDFYLKKTDHKMVVDAPWDTVSWQEFRQQLRDFMSTYDPSVFPIVFPTPPEAI
jgi:5-methylcytosine-specific restriction endonuclease McrBC regulatory subunit McrC